MKREEIKNGLKDFNQNDVDIYTKYLSTLLTDKNAWMKSRTTDDFVGYFKKVAADGLAIDGVNITLQSTGVSYNYIAYKNLMLMAYPESVIDVDLVYDGDEFRFEKDSGKVGYHHTIANVFSRDEDKIIGGYCVIKNKRGEFLTTLTRKEIDKHRKVAKTDFIWKSWFREMCLKTIIKKSCKVHFQDIYQNVETLDNENYDLSKIEETGMSDKQDELLLKAESSIDLMETVEDVRMFYRENIVTYREENLEAMFTDLCKRRSDDIAKK